jgi:hypothetical protein
MGPMSYELRATSYESSSLQSAAPAHTVGSSDRGPMATAEW